MIQKVEHVAIICIDLDRSIKYYSEFFNFQLRERGELSTRKIAFLRHPNQLSFEIELIQDITPGIEYARNGVVNHLAFTVENIETAIAFYTAKGVKFMSDKPRNSIAGTKTIFFQGPDEELLQLVEAASN